MEQSNAQSYQDDDELNIIYQVKKEFSLEGTHDAAMLVASVLQAFRQTLTMDEARTMLNMLPDFFKIVFAANWQRNEERTQVDHLDEFVGLIMERDEKSNKHLFRNEVQTLAVAIMTLKKLQKMVDLENFSGISPALKQELREVSSEAA